MTSGRKQSWTSDIVGYDCDESQLFQDGTDRGGEILRAIERTLDLRACG
jgi:hypothetical protein